MTRVGAENIVDLNAYPIGGPGSHRAQRLIDRARREFSETGFCALPGFIRPDALTGMAAEANDLAPDAYYCRQSHDVYLDAGDENRPQETFVGSVACDLLPEAALLRTLYGWDPLEDFIAAVLQKSAGGGTWPNCPSRRGRC